MRPLQLVLREARVLDHPEAITADDEGARRLAQLDAFPRERPWVRAVLNTSLDGSITGADGTSGPLRNPTDTFAFGVLRALADVILVGAETVRVEDYRRPRGRRSLREPSLRPGGGARPALAIVTRTGALPAGVEPDWPTYLLSPHSVLEQVRRTSGLPAENIIPADSPAEMITALAERGLRGIQCEGGPGLLSALAAAGELDELCLSVSHVLAGGSGPRLMHGPELDQDWRLETLLLGEHAQLARYRRAGGSAAVPSRDRTRRES